MRFQKRRDALIIGRSDWMARSGRGLDGAAAAKRSGACRGLLADGSGCNRSVDRQLRKIREIVEIAGGGDLHTDFGVVHYATQLRASVGASHTTIRTPGGLGLGIFDK